MSDCGRESLRGAFAHERIFVGDEGPDDLEHLRAARLRSERANPDRLRAARDRSPPAAAPLRAGRPRPGRRVSRISASLRMRLATTRRTSTSSSSIIKTRRSGGRSPRDDLRARNSLDPSIIGRRSVPSSRPATRMRTSRCGSLRSLQKIAASAGAAPRSSAPSPRDRRAAPAAGICPPPWPRWRAPRNRRAAR